MLDTPEKTATLIQTMHENVAPHINERLPRQFRKSRGRMSELHRMKSLLRRHSVGTVCESARCPNIGECFSSGEATFMILGSVCSRQCRFCAVQSGTPMLLPDRGEPLNVALAAKEMDLRHVVVTSVSRDDLDDGGASQFVASVRKIRELCPEASVEILVPDFNGSMDAIQAVINVRPDVFNHNLETVPRLYENIRPFADYERSLGLIKTASDSGLIAKSGLMVGLGEEINEVISVMEDLVRSGCDMVTIGQYLPPSMGNVEVREFVSEEGFKSLEEAGLRMGFKSVISGAHVRSSYHAAISAAQVMVDGGING